jgi:hypothetical protein
MDAWRIRDFIILLRRRWRWPDRRAPSSHPAAGSVPAAGSGTMRDEDHPERV